MSLYKCLFCGGKSDEIDEFREPITNEIPEISKAYIEDSDYEWLVCNDCSEK